jgi:hypothetical protein
VRSRSRTPIAESGLFAKACARRPVRVLFPTPPLPLRTCDGVSSRFADREEDGRGSCALRLAIFRLWRGCQGQVLWVPKHRSLCLGMFGTRRLGLLVEIPDRDSVLVLERRVGMWRFGAALPKRVPLL